jgi:hypothetical protein
MLDSKRRHDREDGRALTGEYGVTLRHAAPSQDCGRCFNNDSAAPSLRRAMNILN